MKTKFLEKMISKTFNVDPNGVGKRVDVFLSDKTEYTRSRIKKLCDDGFLKVNEAEKKIYMYSYSPYLDEYVYYDEPERMEETYATAAELETAVFDLNT